MPIRTASESVFYSIFGSNPLRSSSELPISLATCTHLTGAGDAACDNVANQGLAVSDSATCTTTTPTDATGVLEACDNAGTVDALCTSHAPGAAMAPGAAGNQAACETQLITGQSAGGTTCTYTAGVTATTCVYGAAKGFLPSTRFEFLVDCDDI